MLTVSVCGMSVCR